MPTNGGLMINEFGNVGIKKNVTGQELPTLTVNGSQAVKRVTGGSVKDTYIIGISSPIYYIPNEVTEGATPENPKILCIKDESGIDQTITLMGLKIDGNSMYTLPGPYASVLLYVTGSDKAFVIAEKHKL